MVPFHARVSYFCSAAIPAHTSCCISLFLWGGARRTYCGAVFQGRSGEHTYFWRKCQQLKWTCVERKKAFSTAFLVFMAYKKHPNRLEVGRKDCGRERKESFELTLSLFDLSMPCLLFPPFPKKTLPSSKSFTSIKWSFGILRTYLRTACPGRLMDWISVSYSVWFLLFQISGIWKLFPC